jgi:hypothetical protein
VTVEQQPPFSDSHPEPLALGGSGALQKSAEAAAVTALFTQVTATWRARRAGKAAAELAAQDAELAAGHAEHAAAQARWAPALRPDRLADASFTEVATWWGSALPYENADPGAAEALDACERRLRELHPYAMRRYDQLREAGASRADAMWTAAPEFLKHPRPRPAPRDAQQLHLAIDGPADGVTGETWVLRGGTEVSARILDIIKQYDDEAIAAHGAPLSARMVQTTLLNNTNVSPVVAAMAAGLRAADEMVPGKPPAGKRTVAGVGVAAHDWPDPPQSAVAATVIRKTAGGQRRPTARPRPPAAGQGQAPGLHP